MAEYQFPDYETSWALTAQLLAHSSGSDVSLGVAAIRKAYEEGKWQTLRHLFGPDGRLDIKLEEVAVNVSWDKHLKEFERITLEYAMKQIVKEKWTVLTENVNSLNDWLFAFITRYPILLAAKNMSAEDGKSPSISTVIGQKIDQAGIAWNGGLDVQGDYDYSLRRFPVELRQLVKDFLQLCYSYLTERIKANTKSTLRLCLSINPLDLGLLSMQTTGWRTCHTMTDGQYRAGNIGYLQDRATAIAYVYEVTAPLEFLGKTAMAYPKKLWRTLVFLGIENKTAVVGRHFPGNESRYAKALRKELLPLLTKAFEQPAGTIFNNNRVWTDTNIPLEKSTGNAPNRPEGTVWGYIDATTEELYPDKLRPQRITIGHPSPFCVTCGVPRRDTKKPGDIMCTDCRDRRRDVPALACCHCQRRGYDNIVVSGRAYCWACLRQYHTGGRIA